MNAEEMEISRSTPGYRFDVKPEPASQTTREKAPAAAVDDEVRKFFHEVISDPEQPLVLFALEWCEFCWSVRKLFGEIGVKYRAVDLDSVEYQENDLGGKIRAALSEHSGVPTIPQIFVSGRFIGGASDTFDAYREGTLQKELEKAGLEFRDIPGLDPYHLLPAWLHPR